MRCGLTLTMFWRRNMHIVTREFKQCANCRGWVDLSERHVEATSNGHKIYLHDMMCAHYYEKPIENPKYVQEAL